MNTIVIGTAFGVVITVVSIGGLKLAARTLTHVARTDHWIELWLNWLYRNARNRDEEELDAVDYEATQLSTSQHHQKSPSAGTAP